VRKFNVNGTCVPEENYMVDITGKLEQIKSMVDEKAYFTINRGHQYGKTTTLLALEQFLSDQYTVIPLSFEGLGYESFADVEIFSQTLLEMISDALRFSSEADDYRKKWLNPEVKTFNLLGRHITDMSEEKKLVLLIDEVDKISNNQVFLEFLSVLRTKYLARRAKKDFTFYSVILAGVYDIRNIKLKMIQEGAHAPSLGETTIKNSPWNIAAAFEINMSFSPTEIETMLEAYEADYQTEMNISEIAEEIYQFTSGYPVLVSSICKHIDEKLDKAWNVQNVRQAVKLVLKEDSPLFQSLTRNLESNQDLSDMVYDVLMIGGRWKFSHDLAPISLGSRYGYFKEVEGRVKISNKIFEMRISEYFIGKAQFEKFKAEAVLPTLYNDVVQNNRFNMQLCLEKFAKYYHQYYSEKDDKFLERECRFIFLFFMSPILNGRGYAHIESQFTDDRRMDVVINYQAQQFVIELKIWYGYAKHEEAYDQLLGYMNKKKLDEGYLLTFDFRKNRKSKQEWLEINNKKIFDIMV